MLPLIRGTEFEGTFQASKQPAIGVGDLHFLSFRYSPRNRIFRKSEQRISFLGSKLFQSARDFLGKQETIDFSFPIS